jgi:hypothetical protein
VVMSVEEIFKVSLWRGGNKKLVRNKFPYKHFFDTKKDFLKNLRKITHATPSPECRRFGLVLLAKRRGRLG